MAAIAEGPYGADFLPTRPLPAPREELAILTHTYLAFVKLAMFRPTTRSIAQF